MMRPSPPINREGQDDIRIYPRVSAAVALFAGAPCCVAFAAPGDTHLDFTVLRDGDEIGRHVIEAERDGDMQTVKIRTDVLVRVAFLPVYRFEHAGSETWKNGRLVALESHTNDDGNEHVLSVVRDGANLTVDSDGKKSSVAPTIIPASLWNSLLVRQAVLLDTLDGSQLPVTVEDLGEDIVDVHDAAVHAHHYRITGALDRELWYDPAGTLIHVRYRARDNAEIVYDLQ